MKIDLVLTACNVSDHYLSLYPFIYKIWKQKFSLECQLILIANEIPDFLKNYANSIILFPPIPNVNTIFIAQVIRILYPCLYENKNILITDTDIFPISYNYFVSSIKDLPDDVFVSYRDFYLKQQMLSICFNVANSSVWKEIFKINKKEDLVEILKKWYDPRYTGSKNCYGWFTDQKKLYQYVMQWNANSNRLVILNDKNLKFKRLDKRKREYIVSNTNTVLENIKNGKYTDYHSIKPFCKYQNLTAKITETILSNNKF